MSDIVFEYTPRSTYASQGDFSSSEEGYDIWLRGDDGYMDFLGFCGAHELEKNMKVYQDQGDRVFIRRKGEI